MNICTSLFRNLLSVLLCCGVLSQTYAQQKTITGQVTDENNESLPGVNVLVKNSTLGTVTDMDGNYRLNAPNDAETLVFSSIGYTTQEAPLDNRTVVDVSMAPNVQSLSEVVVIGDGEVKKANLTGSIAKITDRAIEDRPVANLGEAFQGQLAGVRAQSTSGRPGEAPTIRIRGANSINGNSEPLYVIDGVPRDNMADLNPNDIASIQILKDAASTSIYGARGGNGVVLIETKNGSGKPSISFQSYVGISQAEKMLDNMNGEEFVAYNIYRRNVDYLREGGSMSDPMADRPVEQQIPDFWLTQTDFTNWQDEVLRNAPLQNYSLSASASGDLGSIFFSLGYLDQEGILIETGAERLNARLNASMNINERMRAGLNLSVASAYQYGENGNTKDKALQWALNTSPLMRLDEGTEEWGYPTDVGATPVNVVERLRGTTEENRDTRILASLWGEYDILDGLTFRSQLSQSYDATMQEYFLPANINNGRATTGRARSWATTEWTIQNTLTYDKSFNDHHINALLGQAATEQNYFRVRADATGYPYETIETLNVATTPTRGDSEKNTYTTASYFGRISYDFQDKYLFTASVRRDGSSRFGADRQWGLFPALTAGWKISEEPFMQGVTWVDLLKPRISWGKSGNDRIGNYQALALLTTDATTSWGGSIAPGVAPDNIPNPDLQWEATRSVDVGLDFNGFDNRLQLSADYYVNTTQDLLFNVTIPNTNGFGSYLTNLGSVENRGWELDVTTYNVNGNFNWSTSFNLARNRNKVLDMGGIEEIISSGGFGSYFLTEVGGPISQFYALVTDGLLLPEDFDAEGNATVPVITGQEEGGHKFIDQDGDGMINSNDYVGRGSNLPDLIYGVTNRLSYKNLSLSVLIQGQVGGEIEWLGSRGFDGVWGGNNVLSRWVRSYKPDFEALYGPGENPIPTEYIEKHGIDMSWDGRTRYPYGADDDNSDDRIYSTTFLRVKNITLSYNVPSRILDKVTLGAARIYVSLDNLKTFSDYPAYTLESNTYGDNTQQMGLDYITYPLSRRAVVGLNVTF